MEGSGDSFEYLLQLMKTLSGQAWTTRQQTDKVEQSLKRLAKQTQLNYQDYSKEPTVDENETIQRMKEKTPEEEMIEENFRLLYQIQQQEYIHSKVCLLIQQINEMIVSMRNFIVDHKTSSPQRHKDFVTRNAIEPIASLLQSQKHLKDGHKYAKSKLELLTSELVETCESIAWNKIPSDDPNYIRLKHQIRDFEDKYGAQIITDKFLFNTTQSE